MVRSDEARARLVEQMVDGNKAKTAAAPVAVILAADVNFHDELPRVFPHFPGARDIFADDTVRENSARFNATIQVGYFILGVRAAGLAAGPMTGFEASRHQPGVLRRRRAPGAGGRGHRQARAGGLVRPFASAGL